VIFVLSVTVEAIGACIFTCAAHDHVRPSPMRACLFLCGKFCNSGAQLAFAAVGLGVTACAVGIVYAFYCIHDGCSISPPIPLILIGGTFIAMAVRHLFSAGQRLLKVTCPAGVAEGGTIIRVDDNGHVLLTPYGDPITDGPALHRVLFSTHAVLVPEGVLPGQQFNVWIGKEPTAASCFRRNNAVAADDDFGANVFDVDVAEPAVGR
jgi:hypothetical protein